VTAGGTPLRSAAPAAEPEEFDEPTGTDVVAAPLGEEEATDTPATAPPPTPRPRPVFKISTFLIVFLGLLGALMLFESSTRNAIACSLGTYATAPASPQCVTGWGPLYAAIGFSSEHLLATMALAGAIEMAITALAYNYTTDWVKAAKVQKWSGAFRKVQMEAIRSGKKDRIAALKPYQERLTRLSSEVTIAQFKGMAITYFMLILIYTWIGLTIANASIAQQTVNLGGTAINVYTYHVFGYFPLWFFIFSLYTIPLSMVFRRVLKQYWVRRFAASNHIEARPPAPPGAVSTT
jgi:uncharacterized membrane protein (DUF106 family)